MTRLLVTTGPESSGKTTLAEQLSTTLPAPLVTEASRDYLTALYAKHPGYRYEQSDLLHIARLQRTREQQALQTPAARLVCDTDLLVLVIWSEVVFGSCAPTLARLFEESLAATQRSYLLCSPEMPWQPDPLRENPHDREQLFERYLRKLQSYDLDYRIMRGAQQERLEQAQRFLLAG
jgi:nicotinamide riboside kinase